MVYGRDKLVPDEYLDDFLNGLAYFWDCGYSAKKIAEEMGFGVGDDDCFYKFLKPEHVYYFVAQYGKECGMAPRVKRKKKAEAKTKVVYGVPYSAEMSFVVANWLRQHKMLIE